MSILFIAILTVIASCIGTVAGFGTSAVMISVLVMFFPFGTVLLLVGLIHWSGSASKTVLFRKGINFSFALGFAIPAIFGSLAGALLVLVAPEELLARLLGIFLVGYVSFLYFKPDFRMPKNPAILGVGGVLAGLSAGLLGIAGSIRSAFFSSYRLSKASFLAATGIAGLAIDTTRILTYLSNGSTISRELLLGLFLFIPAALLGTFLGKGILSHVSEKRFRYIVFFFLVVVGVRLIIFPV